ncbi:MAG: hypothetical protein ABI874_03300 [Chloroflexota bacterium]
MSISSDSTILNIAVGDGGRLWVAASDGIFFRADGGWLPAPGGQPLNYLTTFAGAGSALLAGSANGLIVYSHDGGASWTQGYVARMSETVIALALSPHFAHDAIALAGTHGAGMLRTSDGGRTWQPSNWGMRGYAIMALATAPDWSRGAYALAATMGSLYVSSNGGQAWQPADDGMGDGVVTGIAFSPDFARDDTILVGTEAHGVFRSTNGARSWQRWGDGLRAHDDPAKPPSVNSLWWQGGCALLGTDDGQIFRSTDGGATWARVAAEHASLMCFGHDGRRAYAGLHSGGLLMSDDDGLSWST